MVGPVLFAIGTLCALEGCESEAEVTCENFSFGGCKFESPKECAMLVLSRKLNEQIRIDEQITVTVLRVKGNTVRLGIEAPKEVRVRRGELPRLEKRSQAPLASRTNK